MLKQKLLNFLGIDTKMNENTQGRFIYNGNLSEPNTHARVVAFQHPRKGIVINIQLTPTQYEPVPDWVNDKEFFDKPRKVDLLPVHQSFIDSLQNKENKKIEDELNKIDLTPEEIEKARLELLAKTEIPKEFLTDLKDTIDESIKDVLTENTIDENTDNSENTDENFEQEIIDSINTSKKNSKKNKNK